MMPKEYAPSRAMILACLLPIAVVAIGLARWGVNIPYVDQFTFVALMEKVQIRGLTLADLFAQNNENRPFFPRLIWLGLAGLSRYDVRLELWTNLTITISTFAFFAMHAVRTWRRFAVAVPAMLLPLMSFLVFNWAQWEGWLNGFQTVFFLGSASVVSGLLLLAGEPTWWRFTLALLAGVVGSFSTPNAYLYWPIGLVVLLVATPRGLRAIRSAVWIAVAAGCAALFLAGLSPPHELTTDAVFGSILPRLNWLTNYMGAPLMTVPDVAFPFGLLSVGLSALIVWRLARSGEWRTATPYFAIAAFAIGSGTLISIGRLRLGTVHAVAPGYLTISAWYWAALLTLFPLVPLGRIPQRVLYSLVAVCLAWGMIWGGAGANAYHLRLLRAYEAAVSGGAMSDEVLMGIAQPGTYNAVRERLQFLEDNGLSAYAMKR
jgi:hypothetical protein